MKKLDSIPINIWDDYYEDGYVPKGEIQKTYIYVEDSDLSLDFRKECLEFLLDYIDKHIKLKGVKMWIELYESRKKYPNLVGNPDAEKMFFDRWEIKVENMTHRQREVLVEMLNETVDLTANGIPFNIYSES